MSCSELIEKLKRYKDDPEVMLLDHRCLEAFPMEITEVRRATKKEEDLTFNHKPVVLD